MSIKLWPQQQRPRERLIRQGAHTLSDAELLALFLRTGVAGRDAVQLAQLTVQHFGSLQALFGASLSQFCAIHGLGPAKYAQLQAVMELARRAIGEEIRSGAAMCTPAAVKQYLRATFSGQAREAFHVLFLDVKNRLIEARQMFAGTLTQASEYYLRNSFRPTSLYTFSEISH